MPAHLACRVEISLAESGTATAFAVLHERDVERKRFEDFDGGDADVRLMVTDEGVVPENDVAAFPVAAVHDRRIRFSAVIDRRYMMMKPCIEALLRVMRQRPLVG